MIRLSRANLDLPADFSLRTRATADGLRLRSDNLQAAMGELNRAVGQGPRHPNVDYSGIRTLAQGAGQLSAAAVELRKRNQDVTDKRLMYDAESKLMAGAMDLQTKLTQENDPNRWEELAASHMGDVVSSIDMRGMSDEARQHLTQYADRYQMMSVARARSGAAVKNEQMLVDSALAVRDTAIMNKDPVLAASSVRPLVDGGHITPEEGTKLVVDGGMKIRAARLSELTDEVNTAVKLKDYGRARSLINDSPDLDMQKKEDYHKFILNAETEDTIDNLIASDPNKMIEMVKNDDHAISDLSTAKKQEILDKAFNAQQNNNSRAYAAAADAMASGVITKPEDLDKPQWAQVSPARKAVLKETLRKGQPNDNSEWMELAYQITHYQKTGDESKDTLAYADMEAIAKTRFNGPYQSQLVGLIEANKSGAPQDSDSLARARVTEAFKEGMLGNYKVPYAEEVRAWFTGELKSPGTALSPADQARLRSEVPKEQRIKPGDIVEDQKAKEQARIRMEKILNDINMMKKQGKSAKEMEGFAADQISILRSTSMLPPLKSIPYTPGGALGPNPILPAVDDTYQQALRALERIR